MGIESWPGEDLKTQIDKMNDDEKKEITDQEVKDFEVEYEKQKEQLTIEIKAELYEFASKLEINEWYENKKKILQMIDEDFKKVLPNIFTDILNEWKLAMYSAKRIFDLWKSFWTGKDVDIWYLFPKNAKFDFEFDWSNFQQFYENMKELWFDLYRTSLAGQNVSNTDIWSIDVLIKQYVRRRNLCWDQKNLIKKMKQFMNICSDNDNKNFLTNFENDKSLSKNWTFDEFISVPYYWEVIDYVSKEPKKSITLGKYDFELSMPDMMDFIRWIAKYISRKNKWLPSNETERKNAMLWYQKLYNQEMIDKKPKIDYVFNIIEGGGDVIYWNWITKTETLKWYFGTDKVEQIWPANIPQDIRPYITPEDYIIWKIIQKVEELKKIENNKQEKDRKKTEIYLNFVLHGGGTDMWMSRSFNRDHIKELLKYPEISTESFSCFWWTNFIKDENISKDGNIRYNSNETFAKLSPTGADWSESLALNSLWNWVYIDKKKFPNDFINYMKEKKIISESLIVWNTLCYYSSYNISDNVIDEKEIEQKWFIEYRNKMKDDLSKEHKPIYLSDFDQDHEVSIYEARTYWMMNYSFSEQHTYQSWQRLTDNSQTKPWNNLSKTV